MKKKYVHPEMDIDLFENTSHLLTYSGGVCVGDWGCDCDCGCPSNSKDNVVDESDLGWI